MGKVVEELYTHGITCLQYNGSHKKSKFICKFGHEFEKRATFVLRSIKKGGHGCPVCFNKSNKVNVATKVRNSTSNEKTKKVAIETIQKIGYTLLSEYVNSKSKLKLLCNSNHECELTWENIKSGTRCKKCKFEKQSTIARKKAYEKIMSLASSQGLEIITPLDEYKNKNTRIQFMRKHDQYVFDTCVANIIANKYKIDGSLATHGKLSIDEVNTRLNSKCLSIASGEYTGLTDKILLKCDTGHEFYGNIKSRSCPICNIPSTERKWLKFFDFYKIKYIVHHKICGFELDIFLPDHNIAIECCGLYYHSMNDLIYGKPITKEKHFKKRAICESNGIRLFTIYDNENNSQIWESIIGNAIGLSKKAYARKCEIRKVESKESKEFLIKNHMMGYCSAKGVGLYLGETLVALFTYKKCKNNGIEISRFCNLKFNNVVGAFSRLLKHVENETKPDYVMSFVDLRYGNGSSLLKAGFELKGTTLGWKWTDFKSTYNRLRCRANMDERKLSEREHADELGWYKIYDAGQAKFIKILNDGGAVNPTN